MKDMILSLSGGLDSSSLLFEYKDDIIMAVSFTYGSNHNKMENAAAKLVAEKAGVPWHLVDLTNAFKGIKSGLLSGADAIPDAEYSPESIAQSVVSFRNGIFLSVLAGLADSVGAKRIALASHGGDHEIYLDCRPDFSEAMEKAIELGTENHIKFFYPYINLSKHEVAERGIKAGLNPDWTYSCYRGGEKPCGVCSTCLAEGTKVLMSDMTEKSIEDLKPGDLIWGLDEDTRKLTITSVNEVIDNGTKPVYDVAGVHATRDHKFMVKTKSKRAKFRTVDSLDGGKRLNAEYFGYQWKSHLRITDYDKFERGYLRGLVDGDGHIGDRNVFLCQKSRDVIDEFVELYNKRAAPTSSEAKWDADRKMFIFSGGYAKRFENATLYDHDSIDYILGWLNGFIIADGSVCTNISNGNNHLIITQSSSANGHKCKLIDDFLSKLDIHYNTYEGLVKGKQSFKPEGSMMKSWSISDYFCLPFVYGGAKRDYIMQQIQMCKSIHRLNKVELPWFNETNTIGNARVYDINTGTHNFFANGILVHNCRERAEALEGLTW